MPDGPCLVVSNHNSHLDAAVLMTLFPLRRIGRVHPVAAADYFGTSWLRRTMALLLMNGIPIERHPGRGPDALAPVIDALKAGESLIFFPEGSRGEAGVVGPFRPGVGLLVRAVPGLLVVPVYLSGPERIWPRGQKVPVPLSIDVNVGRPRSYPEAEEARTIAERVREDVLALAPPPLPLPGLRPAPPIRVALFGLDAERRRAQFVRVVQRLGQIGPTLGVSAQAIEADETGVREVRPPIAPARGRAWLGLLAKLFRTREPFRGERFVELVEGVWVDEALDRSGKYRFVVQDGNALVDLMARISADPGRGPFDDHEQTHLLQYLTGQKKVPLRSWWRYARKAPEVWLLNVLNLARPPVPGVLVHASLPSTEVLRSLRSAGTPRTGLENEADLERLQTSYGTVGAVLRRRRRVELVEVDGSAVNDEELSRRVEVVCRELVERAGAEAPAS